MPLVNLKVKPGIYKESSELTSGMSGRWVDGNLIRFYKGQPEPIGGWDQQNNTNSTIGKPRSIISWTSISGTKYLGIGTHKKLYVWANSTFYDITPTRDSGTLTNPFSTTSGSPLVTVADTAHATSVGDYVRFENASAVGGITVDGEYVVTSVTDSDNYVVTHTSNATSTAGPGGGSVDYEYDVVVGPATSTFGFGWGTGTWGTGTWGTSSSGQGVVLNMGLWSLSLWGEDLIASPRDGTIYVWDTSGGTGTRATEITNSPDTNKFMGVSSSNRHMIGFGAHDGSNSDPLFIRWCSQNDYTSWAPTETNTAGNLRVDRGTRIESAIVVAKDEIATFTDTDLYSLRYLGPPLVFGIEHISSNAGIIAPNAAETRGGVVWYMGIEDFFVYDGQINIIPCDVRDYVFNDLNRDQKDMIWCGLNSEYEEVWWFYPSATSEKNDRYVSYNYVNGAWGIGTLPRNVWVDVSSGFKSPIALDDDGNMYSHESNTVAPDRVWLELGDIQADNGDNYIFADKIIPDFHTLDTLGSIDFYVRAKRYPHDSSEIEKGPFTFSGSLLSDSQKFNFRIRGRQLAVYMESRAQPKWRLSSLRMNMRPDGMKT